MDLGYNEVREIEEAGEITLPEAAFNAAFEATFAGLSRAYTRFRGD
jgi:hypothetical protein